MLIFMKGAAGAVVLAIIGALVQAGMQHYLDESSYKEKLGSLARKPGVILQGDFAEPVPEPSHTPSGSTPDGRVKVPGAVTGKDRENREADFLFYVVSQELRWRRGGEEILDAAGRPVNLDGYLRSSGLQSYLGSPGLIALGTASCEEDESRPAMERRSWEEGRAHRRGEILITGLRPALPRRAPDQPPQVLYLLNLGQFKDGDCGLKKADSQRTSDQRKIALIAITWMQKSVQIKEALSNALEKGLLNIDPQSYSLWPHFEWLDMTRGKESVADALRRLAGLAPYPLANDVSGSGGLTVTSSRGS
jgi:hypothetical protein